MFIVWKSFTKGSRAIPLAIGILVATLATHLLLVSTQIVRRSGGDHFFSILLGIVASYIMVGIILGIQYTYQRARS